MILIISSENDRTTNDVIDWLRYYNQTFLRISEGNKLELTETVIGTDQDVINFLIDDAEYNLNDFSSIWYRRSWVRFKGLNFNSTQNSDFNLDVNKQLMSEIDVFSKFFISELGKKSLNKPEDIFINKLHELKLCTDLGINIPKSVVTTRKEVLRSFKNSNKSIITKNLTQGVFVNFNNKAITSYTLLVTDEMIDDLDLTFFPMLFQENIEKVFELRIFYLDGKFYCSAIISQNDEKTKIDFRNYNHKKPNRTPPFNLPEIQRNKLHQLMINLGLNSGSIDLLVTKEGEYVFLEVNPIGQFAQVSKPCNYHLEKLVAEYLIKNK